MLLKLPVPHYSAFYIICQGLNSRLFVIILKNALKKGWIRHFVSLISAPIFFVLKKNSGLRLYMDYYRLNKVIIKN
jgi:hypothetical protein